MIWLLLIGAGLLLLVGPSLWVRSVMKRYQKPRTDLPGTGGELAKHLIERYELNAQLTSGPQPDHFNPDTNTVYLSESNMQGRHLTAVAVATHEVSHAIQYAMKDKRVTGRTQMVKLAMAIEKLGQVSLMLLPVLAVIPTTTGLSRILFIPILLSLGFTSLVHLVTLPVEWDASFGKALPILKKGDYVSPRDLRAVRKILLAAALTYVSSAVFSLLNLGRLWRLVVR